MDKCEWKDRIADFETIDVRHMQGNFFPALMKRASAIEEGCGLEVIQTFEPYPLYGALEPLGFEHYTEKANEAEFHAYFFRRKKLNAEPEAPFRPLALLNYPLIDQDLGAIAADFWNLTWNSERRTLPYETRLLLSLANAVGAGRMRQATRELVKAYVHGLDSKALDDVFELLAWNQGIGYFSSEIGPSTLFQAYKTIKTMEKQKKSREEICAALRENYGEKNPDVKV